MTSTMHIAENYLKVYILLTAFWIVAHFYILFFLHITGMPIRQIEGISRRHAPPLHRLRLNNRLPSSNQIIFFASFLGNFAKIGVKTLTFQDEIFDQIPKAKYAGESLIWSTAKQSGKYEGQLRYPAEDSRYEKPKMDELDL